MRKQVSSKIISWRVTIAAIMALITLLLGQQMLQVSLDTSLKKMVPANHPYIINLFKHIDELSLGNDLRIAVAIKKGDIFQADYIRRLKEVSDAAFYLPGVDKAQVSSLWTPNVRWVEVTIDGFRGGSIIPDHFDGSAGSLEKLRRNVFRSGQVGRLVADNFKSTIVHVPLVEYDKSSGNSLNYRELSDALEALRSDYSDDLFEIHIIGFSKKMGDLIAGATEVASYFLMAIAITLLFLTAYFRCLRSAFLAIGCSLVAVVWQLGLLNILGYGIDPYSMLVPFLVFAIGVSHAVQVINRFAIERAKGDDNCEAARNTLEKLFVPGLIALISDGVGFATLYVIELDVIRELAVAASVGVFSIILTNLIVLPIATSFIGIGSSAIRSNDNVNQQKDILWRKLSFFAASKGAPLAVLMSLLLLIGGVVIGKDLQIGDLDAGAPELRSDSRYNRDVQYITEHYSVSADVLVVMVETPSQQCTAYPIMDTIDRFHELLENQSGVESVISLVTVSKMTSVGMNEGSLKWASLPRDPIALNYSVSRLPEGLMNLDCSLIPVLIFLKDHKAETLKRVTSAIEGFAEKNDSDRGKFLLASGNAGVEAATNETISDSQSRMLLLVYSVVSFLCFISFRSWVAVIAIVTPLIITSILCQALMVILGIGVKVATLPVIALGVGVGVDYGIYIYSRLIDALKQTASVREAYRQTLISTGSPVVLTALTLSIGVGSWMFSDIKYQADMGVLLTFMFIWNMVGAIILLPAIVYYLRSHLRLSD